MTKRKKAPKAPRPKLDISKQAREMWADLRRMPGSLGTDNEIIVFIADKLNITPHVVRRALARKSIADASGRLANPRCPTCGQSVPGSVEADAKARVEKAMHEALESPQNQRVLAELAKR